MIRKYRPEDGDEIVEVWERASAVAHPFLPREFLEAERRNIPEVYLPMAETWVWEADGQVAGFVSLLGNEVGAIFVDPRRHRSGIGRALIDHVRATREELEVEVFEKNDLGRAFYAGMGFVPFEEKVHEPTGFGLLRLRLAGPEAGP